MKIYQFEAKAGLNDILNKNISTSTQLWVPQDNTAKAVETPADLMDDEYCDPDMANINAILVSTNWNKNDDVFTADEVWKARSSPMWKPCNIDHIGSEAEGNQIIGVIKSSMPVDNNYKIITGNTDLPEDYNLFVKSYLWKKYFPSSVGQIIENVKNGSQFVSMECMFSDFGYAIRAEGDDEVSLIPRSDMTSWMTSMLRVYGGTGTIAIDGKIYKIGRWLKDYVFSGMGYVKNPANEGSITFNDFTKASMNLKFEKKSDFSVFNLRKAKVSIYG